MKRAQPASAQSLKIGLALGSGSARGLAHIGVIRAIEEYGIGIHSVAGTSIGALVGASFASGHLDSLEEAFRGIDWKTMGTLVDPTIPISGLIHGKKIVEFLRSHISPASIEELTIPFGAVATDITTGEEVTILDGDLIEAVRSSIAVPGIFTPVRRGTRILADGGLVDPVPVDLARILGAEIVIAVDLNHDIVAGKGVQKAPSRSRRKTAGTGTPDEKNAAAAAEWLRRRFPSANKATIAKIRAWRDRESLPGMLEVILSSLYIMQARITETRLLIEQPDVLIRPPVGSVRLLDFDRAEELITIGYESARGPIGELARRLGLSQ